MKYSNTSPQPSPNLGEGVRKRRAFTLVELIVVIAIIGLLSSVAVVSMGNSRGKARIAAGLSFEQSIHNAEGDEILGQWDFDDCTGTGIAATSAVDMSGNGNNGTLVGTSQWSSDTPNNNGCSISLDSSGYIHGTQTITTLASSSFTVSAWAKRLSPGRWDNVFSLGVGAYSTQIVFGFRNTNVFTCAFWGNDYDSPVTYTDTDWHLWTCAYDISTNKRNLYRDGKLVGGDTPTSPFLGSGLPVIGSYAGNFYGNLDNVRIYRKALTAQAIQKLYAEGRSAHPVAVAER